jgi:hypothetical protein
VVELTLEKAILIAVSLSIAVLIGINLIIPLIKWIQDMLIIVRLGII